MKVPRQVSSDKLIRVLERNWDYKFSRQNGSHIILTTETPAHHSLPVPYRSTIGPGLFRAILKQVCDAKGIELEEILKDFE
jgi:predicted RNA binding protein YcfA (HicA-like mRNA interferase family)